MWLIRNALSFRDCKYFDDSAEWSKKFVRLSHHGTRDIRSVSRGWQTFIRAHWDSECRCSTFRHIYCHRRSDRCSADSLSRISSSSYSDFDILIGELKSLSFVLLRCRCENQLRELPFWFDDSEYLDFKGIDIAVYSFQSFHREMISEIQDPSFGTRQ